MSAGADRSFSHYPHSTIDSFAPSQNFPRYDSERPTQPHSRSPVGNPRPLTYQPTQEPPKRLFTKPDDLSLQGMMQKITSPGKKTGSNILGSPPKTARGSPKISSSPRHQISFSNKSEALREKPRSLPPSCSLSSFLTDPMSLSMKPEHPIYEDDSDSSFISLREEPDNSYDDCMTTVFGFPPSEVNQVISYFERFGDIEDILTTTTKSSPSNTSYTSSVPAGPTWLHIRWKSTLDAQKALGKEGSILTAYSTNTQDQYDYMIGVMPFKRARKMLQNSNNSIIWTSPLPKRKILEETLSDHDPTTKNLFVDKKNFNERNIMSSNALSHNFLKASTGQSVASTPAPSILDRLLESIFGS